MYIFLLIKNISKLREAELIALSYHISTLRNNDSHQYLLIRSRSHEIQFHFSFLL